MTTASTDTVSATANIDAAGNNQQWGYVKEIGVTNGGLGGVNVLCVAGGTWNAATSTATSLNTVGPCDGFSGQSVF